MTKTNDTMTTLRSLLLLAVLVGAASPVAAQDFGAYSVSYSYDDGGRLTEFAVDTTAAITYSYSAGSSLVSRVTDAPTGIAVEDDPSLPNRFALHAAYPNPFNPATVIGYDLPVAERVHLAVYDMLGRRVTVLVDQEVAAGRHRVRWDASGLGSGTYFVRMQTARGPAFIRAVQLVR